MSRDASDTKDYRRSDDRDEEKKRLHHVFLLRLFVFGCSGKVSCRELRACIFRRDEALFIRCSLSGFSELYKKQET